MFTILPLRVLRSIHILLRTRFPQSPFDRPRYKISTTRANGRKLHSSERADLLKGLLIVLTFFCMRIFDASRVYHSIRGQSSIKLYALFSVLEIADRLCCSIGQDIFDVIFSKNAVESASSTNSKPSWLGNLTLGLSYNGTLSSFPFCPHISNSNSHPHINPLLPSSNPQRGCELLLERPPLVANVEPIRRNKSHRLPKIRKRESLPNVLRRHHRTIPSLPPTNPHPPPQHGRTPQLAHRQRRNQHLDSLDRFIYAICHGIGK